MHRLRAQASRQSAAVAAIARRSFASAKKSTESGLQEKLVALCRHRGFIFPGSDIYGGLANSFDYGPLGASLSLSLARCVWSTHRCHDMAWSSHT